MAFDIPPTAKKIVLKSACKKWREFKSRLSTDYVFAHCDQPELLEFPPADYSFIEKAHWDMFVASRLTNEYLEIHGKQTKRGELNIYPHCISRKGYANLEQEMVSDHDKYCQYIFLWNLYDYGLMLIPQTCLYMQSQGDPDIEIDRSDCWIRARQDKDGNFMSDEIKNIANEIVSFSFLLQ